MYDLIDGVCDRTDGVCDLMGDTGVCDLARGAGVWDRDGEDVDVEGVEGREDMEADLTWVELNRESGDCVDGLYGGAGDDDVE